MSYPMQKSSLEIIKLLFFWIGYLFLVIIGAFYFYDKTLPIQLAIFAGLTFVSITAVIKRNSAFISKTLFSTILCFSLGIFSCVSFFALKRVYHQMLIAYYHQTREIKKLLQSTQNLLHAKQQQIGGLPSKAALIATYINILLKGSLSLAYPNQIKIFDRQVHFYSYHDFLQLYREIFFKKEYYRDLKKTDPFIIDCGSNIGLTILFLKMAYPQASILGFEPDHQAFKLLTKNVTTNNVSNIALINKGVANEEGIAYLSATSIGSTVLGNQELATSKTHTAIMLTKLSSYINKDVDLLKMDIEGSEMGVMNDLVEQDKLPLIKNIIMEVHKSNELETFMEILTAANFTCKIDSSGPAPIIYATKDTSADLPNNDEQHQIHQQFL